MSVEMRMRVNAVLPKQQAADQRDLLDATKTQTDLVALLDRTIELGWRPLITSLNSSHGDDSCLGPHGHSRGFGVDVWVDPAVALRFLADMATRNRWVVKIGLGGVFRQFAGQFACGSTIVFDDNDQDHIHMQTE